MMRTLSTERFEFG